MNVTKVDLGQLGGQSPTGAYSTSCCSTRTRTGRGRLPEEPPLPPFTNGPHFSYAVQWFSFAAIAIVGYGVVLRRERATRRRAVDPVEGGG